MSDIWEEQHNNGQLFPPNIDPQADADGDGWSNAEEAVAGTDPFSPNPPAGYLSPQIARIPAVYAIPAGGGDPVLESPEAATVTWPTVPGKHYTLQFSPNLQAGGWLAVEAGFVGSGNEVTYSFALEAQDELFWRVAVTDVDSDNDGLNDAEEHRFGSNPANADTDGDGLTDAVERAQGTNPNSANTDNDGIADSLDAIPWDGNIKWRPAPEARYAVIEIQDSGNLLKKTSAPQATDAILEHLGANGHLVFSRFDGTSKTPITTATTEMAYPWECPWPEYSNFLWDPATGSIAALPDQVGTAGATTPGVGARVTHVDSSGKAHGNGIVSLETLYDSFDGQGVVWHPYTGPGAEYSPISWDSQTRALEFLPSDQNPFMTGNGENLRYGSPLHDATTTGKDRGMAYLDNGTRLICITDAGTPGARTLKLIRGGNQQTLGVEANGSNIGYTNNYFSYAYEGNLLVQMVPDRVVHFTNSVAEHNFCCDRAGNVILATAKPQPATGDEFKLYCADGTTVIPLPATINSVSAVVQIADADAGIPAALAFAPQYAFIGTESGNNTPALWVLAQAAFPIWQKISQRPRQSTDTGTGPTYDHLGGRAINTRGEILHADGSKIFRNGRWHSIGDLVNKETWGNYNFCLTQINNSGMLAGTADYSVKDESGNVTSTVTKAVLLLPVELYSDLNNDGELTSADSGLVGKPYAPGATDAEKDTGTEFIFANDALSNGAWDKEDITTPGKPVDADDDDAEPIIVGIGLLPFQTEIWLEHPASAGLKFYQDKKCTQEIQMSSTNPHIVGGAVAWPADNKVFVRAETVTFPINNPQMEGDLKLMIKPSGGASVGIEGAKMKVTFIKDLGATKFFHGVRNYIFENNTKTFTHHKDYGTSTRYRIVAMREESTVMFGLDTYNHAADTPGPKGIDAVKADIDSDVIINGNQCFFADNRIVAWAGLNAQMTDRCDGRLCSGRQILRPPSDDTHNTNLGGAGARYIGYKMGEPGLVNGRIIIPSLFTFATGQIPEGVPATPDDGIGGLAAKYDKPELGQSENQAIGRACVTEAGKGIIFTATNYVGNAGNAITFAADAHISGVQPLGGGAAGAWELLFLDGSSSVGLVLKNPNDDQQTVIKGGKHTGAPYYYINTYLAFECEKPRN